MEMIEDITWIMTGFIATLLSMEVAWRLARRLAKASITKPIPMEQEVRAQ
jgi:hypothetical protein